MIRLEKAVLSPFRCIESPITLDLSGNVTALSGRNEAGKTTILEQLAKSCYFNENNGRFCFDANEEFPRKRLRELETAKKPPIVTELTYKVSDALAAAIREDIGLSEKSTYFTRITDYGGNHSVIDSGFSYDIRDFWAAFFQKNLAIEPLKRTISSIRTKDELERFLKRADIDLGNAERASLSEAQKYFDNPRGWENPINEYVFGKYLLPNIPRFIFYDECVPISSRICLEELRKAEALTDSERLSKAFIALCGIDADRLVKEKDLSRCKAELEIVGGELSREFLKAWTGNPDLRIELDLFREQDTNKMKKHPFSFGRKKSENWLTYLDIRVKDVSGMVSLPPEKRSKGFQWFFSFWVWFSAIRQTERAPFILLLDEPGLHLHKDAQENLTDFLRTLSESYQLIYTTHSPYMLKSEGGAERVYRIFKDENGTSAEICVSDNFSEAEKKSKIEIIE